MNTYQRRIQTKLVWFDVIQFFLILGNKNGRADTLAKLASSSIFDIGTTIYVEEPCRNKVEVMKLIWHLARLFFKKILETKELSKGSH